MHDDHADDFRLRAAVVGYADVAFGVQHGPLFGPERGPFAEDFPVAGQRRPGLLRRAGVLGQVEREAADQLAAAVVQLDRRSEPRTGEDRLAPHEECVVRCHNPVGRRADEVGQKGDRVDLAPRLGHPLLNRLWMLLHLDRELRGDQPLRRALRKEIYRRIQQQRGHEERDEEREDARRNGRMPVPERDARTEERCERTGRSGGQESERRECPALRHREPGNHHRREDPNQEQTGAPEPGERPRRRRGNECQCRRPEDCDVEREDAAQQENPRAAPGMQREMAQIDGLGVERSTHQAIERHDQERNERARKELGGREPDHVRAGGAASAAVEEPELREGPGAQGDERDRCPSPHAGVDRR